MKSKYILGFLFIFSIVLAPFYSQPVGAMTPSTFTDDAYGYQPFHDSFKVHYFNGSYYQVLAYPRLLCSSPSNDYVDWRIIVFKIAPDVLTSIPIYDGVHSVKISASSAYYNSYFVYGEGDCIYITTVYVGADSSVVRLHFDLFQYNITSNFISVGNHYADVIGYNYGGTVTSINGFAVDNKFMIFASQKGHMLVAGLYINTTSITIRGTYKIVSLPSSYTDRDYIMYTAGIEDGNVIWGVCAWSQGWFIFAKYNWTANSFPENPTKYFDIDQPRAYPIVFSQILQPIRQPTRPKICSRISSGVHSD